MSLLHNKRKMFCLFLIMIFFSFAVFATLKTRDIYYASMPTVYLASPIKASIDYSKELNGRVSEIQENFYIGKVEFKKGYLAKDFLFVGDKLTVNDSEIGEIINIEFNKYATNFSTENTIYIKFQSKNQYKKTDVFKVLIEKTSKIYEVVFPGTALKIDAEGQAFVYCVEKKAGVLGNEYILVKTEVDAWPRDLNSEFVSIEFLNPTSLPVVADSSPRLSYRDHNRSVNIELY